MELGIVMDPSKNIFWYILSTIQSMWEEHLCNINPLLSDKFFHSFTRCV
jgi:hypothetical protein